MVEHYMNLSSHYEMKQQGSTLLPNIGVTLAILNERKKKRNAKERKTKCILVQKISRNLNKGFLEKMIIHFPNLLAHDGPRSWVQDMFTN